MRRTLDYFGVCSTTKFRATRSFVFWGAGATFTSKVMAMRSPRSSEAQPRGPSFFFSLLDFPSECTHTLRHPPDLVTDAAGVSYLLRLPYLWRQIALRSMLNYLSRGVLLVL